MIAAAHWLKGIPFGTGATVVAVACEGFLMLTGHVNWRRGGVVTRRRHPVQSGDHRRREP